MSSEKYAIYKTVYWEESVRHSSRLKSKREICGVYTSIKDANAELLKEFNQLYEVNFPNWGLASNWYNHSFRCECGVIGEGCRYFTCENCTYTVGKYMEVTK